MNKEVKQKWISALRSGEYKQGTGRLKREDEYCCLGVLCDLYIKEHKNEVSWEEKRLTGYYFRGQQAEYGFHLPPEVITWAGITSDNPNVHYECKCSPLTKLNDRQVNFNTISELIEEQL